MSEPVPEHDGELLTQSRLLSKQQLMSFVDPLLILREEFDYAEHAIRAEAERLGKTILSTDVTVEIIVRAVVK